MKLAKFRYHDCTTNLKIAQGLLISIKHKEAAAEVIKQGSRINIFYPKQALPNLPRLQIGPGRQLILLCIVHGLGKSTIRQRPVGIKIGHLLRPHPAPKKGRKGIVILARRQVDTSPGKLKVHLQAGRQVILIRDPFPGLVPRLVVCECQGVPALVVRVQGRLDVGEALLGDLGRVEDLGDQAGEWAQGDVPALQGGQGFKGVLQLG